MSRTARNLLPSLWDRLADLSVDGVNSEPWYTVDEFVQTVRRDLEDLLNTQRSIPHLEDDFPELSKSLLNFGVPDPASFALDTPAGRRRFAGTLAEAIEVFEPRLRNVQIEMLTGEGQKFRDLEFRVVATLAVEAAPQIIFESQLHIPSGQFTVGQIET